MTHPVGKKPIEIYVGEQLIWKDGAPGPEYAALDCYAEDDDYPSVSDAGTLRAYKGTRPSALSPACSVVFGTPPDSGDFSLTFSGADDYYYVLLDASPLGQDGWQIKLSDQNEGKPQDVGFLDFFYDDEATPARMSKIVMGVNGTLDIYVRALDSANETLFFVDADDWLSTSIDLFSWGIGAMYPIYFRTFGGNHPSVGFWTNFRKCKEIGVGGGSSPPESAVAVHAPYAATLGVVGAGEIKWFKVTLAAGDYRLHTTDSPDPADYDTHLALFGADGKVIAESDDVDLDNSDYRSSITKALADGTYYVGLTAYGTAFSDGFGAVLDGNDVPAGTIFKIEAA